MSISVQNLTQHPNRFIYIFSIAVLVAVGIYYLYMAVDGLALQEQSGAGKVVGKDYRPPGRTYVTQVIAGRTTTLPQVTPEVYILKLDIGGKSTEYPVAKEFYNATNSGDQVRVSYKQRRITGALQVVSVSR
jgi:hypothetical protein